MMRCGDCKHWAPVEASNDEDFELLKDFGQCTKADGQPAQFSHGYNKKPGHVYNGFREDAGDRLMVPCDGSGYSTALLTREQFGCILFEAGAKSDKERSRDE